MLAANNWKRLHPPAIQPVATVGADDVRQRNRSKPIREKVPQV
jgi:hypothetical protein